MLRSRDPNDAEAIGPKLPKAPGALGARGS